MKNGCEVSVIIPVYNAYDYTERCLESLYASMPKGFAFETIVVDNGSFDETTSLADAKYNKFRCLHQPKNLGFARACNIGADAATGRYLYFLNNDTYVFPGAISALHDVLTKNRSVGIAGSRLLYPDFTVQHAGIACTDELTFDHVFRGYPSEHPFVLEKRGMLAVTGASLMIEKEDFFSLGKFDEDLINSYEDIDLCLKMRKSGREVLYAPDSVLLHYEGSSEGRKLKESASRKRFLEKWEAVLSPDYVEKTVDFAARLEMKLFAGLNLNLHLPDLYSRKGRNGYDPFRFELGKYLLVKETRIKLQSVAELARIQNGIEYHLLELMLYIPRKIKSIFNK